MTSLGKPERRHQHRPGVARGNHCRLGDVLPGDRCDVTDHPAAAQHRGGDRKMDDARLDHNEAGVSSQNRRAAQHHGESQARPLHQVDPSGREVKPSELYQTGGYPDARRGPDAPRGIDNQKQDRRQKIFEEVPQGLLRRRLAILS